MKIKTDNGWYNINDKKPESGQRVLVVMEREESAGCSYVASIQESLYSISGCNHYFSGENKFHKVRFWREIVEYPYPNAVVKKEVEYCKKRNVYPLILDYQKRLGYEYSEPNKNQCPRGKDTTKPCFEFCQHRENGMCHWR